jgi:regulator of replication initiation timing
VKSAAVMSMAKTATHSVELEPIDRLEEKVKRLVGLVDRMKAEQTRQTEENQRLSREIETLRARIASNETLAAELATLRDERDVIRTRVGDMLEQLEALNL